MLVALIGTLWVVSFIGVLLLTTVVYDIIVIPDDGEPHPAYVLTGRRLLTTLFLSLATFYAGLSRNVDKLPPLVEYRLAIQPIGVWPAYVWMLIAVAFLAMAAISELIGMDWRRNFDFSRAQAALSTRGRTSPAAVAAALPNRRPHPSEDYLLPRSIQFEEHPSNQRNLKGWKWWQLRGMATAASVLLVALLGLFLLNRSGIFGAISRVAANYSITTILPGNRSTPTPTPSNGLAWAVTADDGGSASSRSLAVPSDANSTDETTTVALPASTAIPAATLPPASTPAPTATATPIAQITVNNAAGINARSAPNLSADVLQVLLPGTSLAVIGEERQGDWISVRLLDGDEAWVFADLISLSRPLAGAIADPALASIDNASEDEKAAPNVVAVGDETNRVPQAPPVQAVVETSSADTASATSGAPEQTVHSSSFSGAITLLEPADGTTGSGQMLFRWQAPTAGDARAYEVVLWREGESPLADGASLGAPTQGSELRIDLAQRGIEPGSYQWGVLLVQTGPYRRLAHLSGGRTIVVVR